MSHPAPWIGVDLDGTLAEYRGWHGPEHIGPPIPLMVARVKQMLADGFTVKIFTARACDPAAVDAIEAWCDRHIGRKLQVTNVKDFACLRLYDDRAVAVEFGTGRCASWSEGKRIHV